ncbi:MAG: glycine cleavage system aminomethyltransferase GcvT [Waddliaceae bacterium]
MKTALYERHKELNAKIVDFGGWEMPLQYEGILAEHRAVRENVGVFDVSHMGRVDVEGEDAEMFLDFLSTNAVRNKKDGRAIYTVFCNEKGTCVDDAIIFRRSQTSFFVVFNASNREKDLNHFKKYASNFKVQIQDRYTGYGILALQGPKAAHLLNESMPPMRFVEKEDDVVISSTGYTGSGGFEIYASNENILKYWDLFLEKGASPCGLGARDTLRLEMGYALYGHELSEEISPLESISAWTVNTNKEFLGKEHLSDKRRAYAIVLDDKAIARQGCAVYLSDQQIGDVTSGNFSPTLEKSIALILVDQALNEGDKLNIQIRKRKITARVVKLPFVQI